MEGGGLGVEEDIQVLEPSTRTLTASSEPMPIFERTLGVSQTAQVGGSNKVLFARRAEKA